MARPWRLLEICPREPSTCAAISRQNEYCAAARRRVTAWVGGGHHRHHADHHGRHCRLHSLLPRLLLSFLNPFKILDFSCNILPLACLRHVDFIDALVLTTPFPICITAAMFAVYSLHYSCRTAQLDKSNRKAGIGSTSGELKAIERRLKAKYVYLFLLLTCLVLPSATTAICQMFVCQNIDPANEGGGMASLYLAADCSIACSGPHYRFGVAWAVCMILVCPSASSGTAAAASCGGCGGRSAS